MTSPGLFEWFESNDDYHYWIGFRYCWSSIAGCLRASSPCGNHRYRQDTYMAAANVAAQKCKELARLLNERLHELQ